MSRFVILSTCPDPWGGSEELWAGAARALCDRGHRVEVLKTVVDADHPRIRELRERSCPVRELQRSPPRFGWRLAALFVPRRLALGEARRQLIVAGRRLLCRRPDLVIVAQGQNFDAVHLAELCRRLRLPYVVISQKASDLQWPRDEARPYFARALGGARLSVFVSEHNRRLTEEQIGARLVRAVVLGNPVLAGAGGPLPWPTELSGELRLACVGRLFILEKGQDLLLRLLARDRWRERALHVSFIGMGMHRVTLEQLAASLRLTNVSFPGHVADIEAVWRNHHALVLPSRAEGLPLALLEAMSCGRPSIVTDVGGIPELIQDGSTGFIAEAASVGALDAALERAWARRRDWPALGLAAAARVRELVPGDPALDLAERLVALAHPPVRKASAR